MSNKELPMPPDTVSVPLTEYQSLKEITTLLSELCKNSGMAISVITVLRLEKKPLPVLLTKERYEELMERDRVLAALEAGGVDNWEGYGECFSGDEFDEEIDEEDED
jgi:hypothetical protein